MCRAILAQRIAPNIMRSTKGVAQNDTQSDIQNGTQDDTQDGTQGVTQDVTHGVPQDVPQDKELDDWIEKQIRNNPQISTEDLAKLSNRSSRTLKRCLAKCHMSVMSVVIRDHWEVLSKE